MTLVSLLVALVVLCLLWWAATSILRAFSIGDPIATLVKVIFVIIAVVYLLSWLGAGLPSVRLR